MKKIVAFLAVAFPLVGCASTSVVGPAAAPASVQAEDLAAENQVIRDLMVRTKLLERQRSHGVPAPADALAYEAAPIAEFASKPVPKNLARPAGEGGCGSAPGMLEVANDSAFILKVEIDGEPVSTIVGDAALDFVRPKQAICLSAGEGEHVVAVTAFLTRSALALERAKRAAESSEGVEIGKLDELAVVPASGGQRLVIGNRQVLKASGR